MTTSDLLISVKEGLGITGDYQDTTLKIYIDEVLSYMVDAGVPNKTLLDPKIIGVVTRGVSDLWANDTGVTKLSPYFFQRITQLACDKEA